MDLERRETMQSECNVNGHIIEYDVVLTQRNAMWENNHVYIGKGTVHMVKGILQYDDREMYFYNKK